MSHHCWISIHSPLLYLHVQTVLPAAFRSTDLRLSQEHDKQRHKGHRGKTSLMIQPNGRSTNNMILMQHLNWVHLFPRLAIPLINYATLSRSIMLWELFPEKIKLELFSNYYFWKQHRDGAGGEWKAPHPFHSCLNQSSHHFSRTAELSLLLLYIFS